MKTILPALVLSCMIHALLLAGGAFFFFQDRCSDASVSLDLSSVELSFSEKEDKIADAVQSPASASAPLFPPVPNEPKPQPIDKPLFSVPEASIRLPEPKEQEERLMTSEAAPVIEAPRQALIDAPPRPRRNIVPDYPEGARRRGEEGGVTVEFTVDADGRVSAASVFSSSGFPELDAAALRAVKSARFVPARKGSSSVEATARLKLSFKLR